MAATNKSKMAGAKNDVVSDVQEVVEDVKELAEDTVELVELRASWLVRNPKYLAMSVFVGGAAIGSVVTYLVVRSRLRAKYQRMADEQVADVKEHYSAPRLIAQKPDLDTLASQTADAKEVEAIIDEQGYTGYDKVEPTVEPPQTASQIVAQAEVIDRNVFESDDPETYFDPQEEAERRATSPNEPFVITADEFNENDSNFQQQSLTYYDGDDVLCDDADQVVDNIDGTIGFQNLLRFGHGSGDPSIVYIRNNRLELDIEVVHSDGKFAKEVLGFDDEQHLQHSDRRVRKFRDRHDE